MAITSNTYTGNGTNKLFSITFPYLVTSDINVYLNGVLQTITTQYSFANATTVEFVTAPANGAVILLDRSTDDSVLQATFFPGSSIRANDLNFNFDQVLYLSQETAAIAQNQSTAGLQAQITAANNTSNTALTTANAATVTANAADTTANGIAGTANTALTNANAAVVTSNTANSTANAATVVANSALATVTGLTGVNLNRLINGDMLFSQRYASGPFPIFGVGTAYILDRWRGFVTIAGNMRLSQIADAPPGFVWSQRADAVTGATISSGSFFLVTQPIEGFNVSDFAFGTANAATVTLSFWVKSSITGTHSGALRNVDATRSYPFSYSISVANTWEQKAITIPGDTTGTWLRGPGIGLDVMFDLGSGSSIRSTAGAWTSSNSVGVTGAATPMATAGATWFITGVQLEKGNSATAFERVFNATAVINVQRYYSALANADTLPVTAFTDQARGYFKLPVTMRVTPACSFIYDLGAGAVFAIGGNGAYQSSAHSTISGFSVRADAEL